MSAFDPQRVRQLAAALQTNERYIEKDWHVARALGAIATVQVDGVAAVFSGGTSLAVAWRLINRFSENIDFKVRVDAPSASAARTQRDKFLTEVLSALSHAGFEQDGDVVIGNGSRFFRGSFHYGATFPEAAGARPTLRIEMAFGGTHLEPVPRTVQSRLAQSAEAPPEVASMLCVDPVETAADKISALAWRTAVRDRTSAKDDPTIVRHIHDLAALAPTVAGSAIFPALARRILAEDAARTRQTNADGLTLLNALVPTIGADPLWRWEYEQFVQAVSFGPDAQRIPFDHALAACGLLASRIVEG